MSRLVALALGHVGSRCFQRRSHETPLQAGSRLRIIPNPIPFLVIEQIGAGFAAVVSFVPANRIENERSIVRAAIVVRLTGDDILWQLRDKSRFEFIERIRKTSLRE